MTTPAFLSNASLSLIPSSSDLLMAVPRLGSSIAELFGFGDLSWFNANLSANDTQILSTSAGLLNWTSPPVVEAPYESRSFIPSALLDGLSLTFTRLGSFDGVFGYILSKWAFSTVVMALLLNRTHVFASTREPVHLTWKARLFIRIIPTLLLVNQAIILLQALRCQTGFHLPEVRFKDSSSVINKSWVSSPGLTSKFTSILLFWQTTEDSCATVQMTPKGDDSMAWHGSAAFLWPLFLVLGASQFAEVVASALQGRQPRSETGMSVFEHSLAFAEAETVARAAVGIGLWGLPKSPTSGPNASESDSAHSGKLHTFTRAMLLQKLNVPPEVLLISLISCGSHLSSQVLAITGLQHRFRLINTGVWGILFLGLFFYSFFTYAQPSVVEDVQIIRYPTVCIIGFIPHLVTVVGALVCAQVYVFAIASALFSSPQHWRHLQLKDRINLAHQNMSASASWTKISVSMSDDFYQFVLRVGYQMMMAAAEAVYFNEGLQVTLTPKTWLEKARYDEAMKCGRTRPNPVPSELQHDLTRGDGIGLVDEAPHTGPDGMPMPSGYARERKTMANVSKAGAAAMREEGVGISQRSGRWYMSWKLVEQTSDLVEYCAARLVISILERVPSNRFRPPKWLFKAAKIHQPPDQSQDGADGQRPLQRTIEFWRLTKSGDFEAAKDNSDVDVEYETRKRLALESPSQQLQESRVDDHLYVWWKAGGWWGESDSSGEYRPSAPPSMSDFDATSVITEASSGWETESVSSNASDTTVIPVRSRRRAISPTTSGQGSAVGETSLYLRDLANLLDPKSFEQKEDARLLAHRIRASDKWQGPTTRSRYRRNMLRESLNTMPGGRSPLLSADDEVLMLEHLINTRRELEQAAGTSWREGGAGMGDGGPQCAVCQSAPRSVLVWPCRCLSLCEECRVQLAENNFATCVCCRRDVVAFSRLYVP